MFKRREPLSRIRLFREFFWPSMGWKRSFQYVRHRIVRLSDSSHKIAIGLACGVAVSFTPLVGTHFVQAGLVAYLLRGNLLASLVGTFIGNPWTFPFIWWSAISLGATLLSVFGIATQSALPDDVSLSMMWEIALSEPFRLFLPWLFGGYVLAILSGPFSYFLFYHLVRGAKAARAKAKLRRMHKVAKEVTGQLR